MNNELIAQARTNPSLGIYYAKPNQSIYDVCLQVYGTLDYIVDLMVVNSFGGLNNPNAFSGAFIFEVDKVNSTKQVKVNEMNGIAYGTLFFTPSQYYYELRDDYSFEFRDDYSKERLD